MKEQLGIISEWTKGVLVPQDASDVYAHGVCVDTRSLRPGQVFIALKAQRDGHDFLQDAYERGAIAAIVSKYVDIPLPQIVVKDTLFSLGELARLYRKKIAPKVIAITGSVAKTTTREMIYHVLKNAFEASSEVVGLTGYNGKTQIIEILKMLYNPYRKVHSAKLNYNNLIGLPLTLLDMDEGTLVAVVELGINQPGEMERLAEISAPDMAVLTMIAPVHLEHLRSMDNILHEKLKILDVMLQDAPFFINIDCEYLAALKEIAHKNTITYGLTAGADIHAENLTFINGKPSFVVDGVNFELNLLGKAPIYPALAAIAVASQFDISTARVAELIREFKPQPHRMQMLKTEKIRIIDDSYNSSPAALREALETIARIPARRRMAILGDMLELGEFTEQYHRQVGEMLFETNIDGVIFFGPSMKFAHEAALKANFDRHLFWTEDFDEALSEALSFLAEGDLLLIKGSHALGMERFVTKISEHFGYGGKDD